MERPRLEPLAPQAKSLTTPLRPLKWKCVNILSVKGHTSSFCWAPTCSFTHTLAGTVHFHYRGYVYSYMSNMNGVTFYSPLQSNRGTSILLCACQYICLAQSTTHCKTRNFIIHIIYLAWGRGLFFAQTYFSALPVFKWKIKVILCCYICIGLVWLIVFGV